MIHLPTTWLPMAIAAVMAALSLWLNHIAGRPLPQDDAAFRHDPDMIVDHFVATAFDRHGYPRYALSAARMTHYMDDDSTELDAPHFEQHRPDAPTLRADARRGVVSSNGEHVHLLGGVRVTSEATAGSPGWEMTTEYLHITPEAQLMRTDKPAEVRQEGSWMKADSLLVDGKARTVALKGQVRGSYEIHR